MAFETPSESAVLIEEFAAAYVPYVDRIVAERGYDVPGEWQETLDEGRAWLVAALRELLQRPYAEQRRSPLEIFQEAMRVPTDALERAGLEPAAREETVRAAMPGDRFALAPASSQELGREAWEAHLAWGVAKAKAVARVVPAGAAPRVAAAQPSIRRRVVALVGTDVMDRSKIEPVVRAAGFSLEVWRNPAAIEAGLGNGPPVVVLVDLRHPAADDAIRRTAEAGARTYGFGPHVDDVALVRARSLGAADALARAQFFRRLESLLPTQA